MLYFIFNLWSNGETYCIGGDSQISNIYLVKEICNLFNKIKPSNIDYKTLIEFVNDRPGHDFRYAIDNTKIRKQLGWQAKNSLSGGLMKTLNWYLNNLNWCREVMDKSGYKGQRIGDK